MTSKIKTGKVLTKLSKDNSHPHMEDMVMVHVNSQDEL